MEALTIGELLAATRRRLAQSPFEIAGREAALLLSAVTGLSEAQLYARDTDEIQPAIQQRYEDLIERRLRGEPVAYLLERREFWGLDLVVNRGVLIPRPETEHLVEAVLGLELEPNARILEIGTGSGAIALALASEQPNWRLLATDRSPEALAVAALNRRQHDIDSYRLSLLGADLVSGLEIESFDLIVANLPYIGDSERPDLSTEVVDFEPHQALFGGGLDGTEIFGRFFQQLDQAAEGSGGGTTREGDEPTRSRSPLLALEIGAPQAKALTTLAAQHGWHREHLIEDYAGRHRVLILSRYDRSGPSPHTARRIPKDHRTAQKAAESPKRTQEA